MVSSQGVTDLDGICFATFLFVLHLDDLVTRTPRLPRSRFGVATELTASAGLHLAVVLILMLLESVLPEDARRPERITAQEKLDVARIVFLAPDLRPIGGGGGGGGNQHPGPIRRAQGVGSDALTLRVRKSPPVLRAANSAAAVEPIPERPSIVLDAVPLASGTFEQLGLPTGGVSSGTSTGPGSGGGVGSGVGTGIGAGRGPGLGSGSGGGVGGGVYRPGGAVTAPRVIREVKPTYTTEAMLQRIQGTVTLEVVVTREGCAAQMRVIRSLEHGLDREAMAAVAQWQFEPGRLAGTPVDVLVNVMIDFWIR